MPGRDLPDLDQRLRSLPAALAVDAPAGLAEQIAHQGRRRRWLRRATAAAAVLVLLGGVAVTRSVLVNQPAPVLNPGLLVQDATPAQLAAGRWQALPPMPVSEPGRRTSPAVVWTGRQLIVWGGATSKSFRSLTDGAAYDPGTRRWTPLRPPPRASGWGWSGERRSGPAGRCWSGVASPSPTRRRAATWLGVPPPGSPTTPPGGPGGQPLAAAPPEPRAHRRPRPPPGADGHLVREPAARLELLERHGPGGRRPDGAPAAPGRRARRDRPVGPRPRGRPLDGPAGAPRRGPPGSRPGVDDLDGAGRAGGRAAGGEDRRQGPHAHRGWPLRARPRPLDPNRPAAPPPGRRAGAGQGRRGGGGAVRGHRLRPRRRPLGAPSRRAGPGGRPAIWHRQPGTRPALDGRARLGGRPGLRLVPAGP